MSLRFAKRLTPSLVASAWLLLPSPPTQAQFAVIDVASVTQLIQQAQTLARQLEQTEAQLTQARTLYQSLTGPRGMELLLSGTVRNYLPNDWQGLALAIEGHGSYGSLSSEIRNALQANAVLSAGQLATLPAVAQAKITASRNNVALLQGLTQEALASSSGRFASIQRLIEAIPTATDQKGILELQARIAAEQGMLQNEQTKLQSLYQVALSQTAAQKQRESEQVIAAYGSFATRFEPSP